MADNNDTQVEQQPPRIKGIEIILTMTRIK
jgi:hypothetical protein